jgi:neutral ceramidase
MNQLYGINDQTVKTVLKALFPGETGTGAVRLGELVIAGVPGEMTAPLGLKVKSRLKESGLPLVAIGGLADEWVSYILTREQYTSGGGYESSMSFYGAGLGEVISEAMVNTALPLARKQKDTR